MHAFNPFLLNQRSTYMHLCYNVAIKKFSVICDLDFYKIKYINYD